MPRQPTPITVLIYQHTFDAARLSLEIRVVSCDPSGNPAPASKRFCAALVMDHEGKRQIQRITKGSEQQIRIFTSAKKAFHFAKQELENNTPQLDWANVRWEKHITTHYRYLMLNHSKQEMLRRNAAGEELALLGNLLANTPPEVDEKFEQNGFTYKVIETSPLVEGTTVAADFLLFVEIVDTPHGKPN